MAMIDTVVEVLQEQVKLHYPELMLGEPVPTTEGYVLLNPLVVAYVDDFPYSPNIVILYYKNGKARYASRKLQTTIIELVHELLSYITKELPLDDMPKYYRYL